MTRLFILVLLLLNFAAPVLSQTANNKAEALLRREMRERRIPGLPDILRTRDSAMHAM